MKRILYLSLLFLFSHMVYGQSSELNKVRDKLMTDLTSNRFKILESGTIKVTPQKSYVISDPDREYPSGWTYAFAFVFDDCSSCELDVYYINNLRSGKTYPKKEIINSNGITATYFFVEVEATVRLTVYAGSMDGKARPVSFMILKQN